jgi:hypothetical protein
MPSFMFLLSKFPMPPELTAILTPDEKVLWHGQPRPYVFMLRGIHSIAYGITWSILGAFWFYGTGGVGPHSVFTGWWSVLPLFCFPFILTGFSFFFYPIRLGAQARRTWYVVTNQRIFIAELVRDKPPQLRVFRPDEMGAPQIAKRFDGLYDVVLTLRAQSNPHLQPRLDSGFFGLPNGELAAGAVNTAINP